MAARMGIIGITADEKDAIRRAVRLGMDLWPNSHLGDNTRREDMRGAFYLIRSYFGRGQSMMQAAGAIELDAYRHEDM